MTAFITSAEAASAGAESTKQMQAKVYILTHPTPHTLRLSFVQPFLLQDHRTRIIFLFPFPLIKILIFT